MVTAYSTWSPIAVPDSACDINQVTNTTEGFKDSTSINADGTRIAFNSNSDLTGDNADGNPEIYLFDANAPAPGFTQITNTTVGNSSSTSINADGTRIAFDSSSDLTGGNADGSGEVFVASCPITRTRQPPFTEALGLEKRYAYSLIEAMLSLVAMNVEHTGKCTGSYDANVIVSQNGALATADIDDVDLEALDTTNDFGATKGTLIRVNQTNSPGELGDVEVADLHTASAYDFYGTMATMAGKVHLDGDLFDEHIIKDFWEVDFIGKPIPPEGTGTHIVLDYGYELITKLDYPRAKWNEHSYLWRSNGGNGYILIEKHLIAPDPENNPCWMTYTALVGDLGGGFQTIGGEIELDDVNID